MKIFNPIPRFEIDPIYLCVGRYPSGLFALHFQLLCVDAIRLRCLFEVYYDEECLAETAEGKIPKMRFCILFRHFHVKISSAKTARLKSIYRRHEEGQK